SSKVRETVVLPTPPLSAPTTITTGFAILILLEAPRHWGNWNIRVRGLGDKMAKTRGIYAQSPAGLWHNTSDSSGSRAVRRFRKTKGTNLTDSTDNISSQQTIGSNP